MKKFLSIILSLFCTYLAAQATKFGKVTLDELKAEHCEKFPEAKAEILACSNEMHYEIIGGSIYLMEKKYFKVKVYDKSTDWVNQEIVAYKNSSEKEEITGFKANSYNLENGKIVKNEVQRKETFKEDATRDYTQYNFTFPNIKEGSIIEWTYTKSSPFIRANDRWYFQYDIPAQNVYFEAAVPQYTYNRIDFRNQIPASDVKTKEQTIDGYPNSVYQIVYNNIQPTYEEPYLFNIEHFRPSIKIEISEISVQGQSDKNYITSWETLNAYLNSSDYFGKHLKTNKIFTEETQKIVTPNMTPSQKLDTIFNFVKSKMGFNGKDRLNFKTPLNQVYNSKTGESTQINFIAIQMLRAAGIEAYPLITSTIQHGYINPQSPTVTDFNHTLVYAKLPNDTVNYYFDASEKRSAINILPKKDIGTFGVILLKDGKTDIIDLKNKSFTKKVTNITAKVDEEGILTGNVNYNSYNYDAFKDQKKWDEGEDNFKSYLATIYQNTQYKELKTKFDEKNKNFSYSFDFQTDEIAQNVNDKIIIEPLVLLQPKTNPFTKESRIYPIQFENKLMYSNKISLQIPENYQVENLPKDLKLTNPEKTISYQIIFKNIGNTLTIQTQFKVDKEIYSADTNYIFKTIFEQIITKESEKIILSKK